MIGMHSEEKTEEKGEHQMSVKEVRLASVHSVLAHSYTVYFLAFLSGLFLDFIFPFDLFKQSISVPIGLILIVLASLLILWAQRTSSQLKVDQVSYKSFHKGPYRFSRIPTQLGLSILMLGFGILTNAVFIIFFTIISFIIAKFFFSRKASSILADKYGAPYLKYKKLVRF